MLETITTVGVFISIVSNQSGSLKTTEMFFSSVDCGGRSLTRVFCSTVKISAGPHPEAELY